VYVPVVTVNVVLAFALLRAERMSGKTQMSLRWEALKPWTYRRCKSIRGGNVDLHRRGSALRHRQGGLDKIDRKIALGRSRNCGHSSE
jgi:hypothetical protein